MPGTMLVDQVHRIEEIMMKDNADETTERRRLIVRQYNMSERRGERKEKGERERGERRKDVLKVNRPWEAFITLLSYSPLIHHISCLAGLMGDD